jgi:GNAT superfamily N-acetyltransferase
MKDFTFSEKRERERAASGVASVRAASPADDGALRGMYARLSGRSIHLRFHAPFPEVPEWLLNHLIEVGRYNGGSLVAVVDGGIVGHAIYVRSENRREAEAAIVVEDRWQSNGIGRLLLSRLADAARREGVEVFTGEVLGENRRMRSLAASLFPGSQFEIEGGVYATRMPLRASSDRALPDRDAA